MRNFLLKKLKITEENYFKFSFLMPSIIGCLIFIFIPTILSFGLSFTKWNLIGHIKFIGLTNYIELFSSREFWFILKNTVYYAIATTIIATIIPLILASVLNNKIKGANTFKTIYFMPFITPMIVIALIWQWIFDPNIGLVNTLLKTHFEWLYDINLAMPVLIFISVWKLIGYNMIIFISGFSSINEQVYEAAKIDGANNIETFFKITCPLLSPTIFFVLLITTISSFQVFDLIYLMTQGGPENATNILVYWLYKNAFEFFEVGKASAIAYILFFIIFILTITQWNLRKRWVENENPSLSNN